MNKNGNFQMEMNETLAENVLIGTNYTKDNPYTITGTTGDQYRTLDLYSEVTPGKTYYLVAECFPEWAPSHGAQTANYGKGTIWLYVSKTFNASSMGYDTPVCFSSSNWVSEGIWKYTIPDGYHMVRIRTNTYANGTDSVTAKFWDIKLIPADKCADERIAAMKILSDSTYVSEIIEM